MATNILSPLKTMFARLRAAQSSSALVLAKELGRKLLALPVPVLLALVVMLLAWSCEHGARVKTAAEAGAAKASAAGAISALEKQAAAAVAAAGESAEAARRLEAQRDELTRQADGLRQRLASLRSQETARTAEAAALPAAEAAARVAARLRADGAGPGPQSPAAPSGPAPVLALSAADARRVETAFIGLDSCRQQAAVMVQQAANCEQRVKLGSDLIAQQKSALAELNSALAAKDGVIARREQECRTEVKAARGTWQSRLMRAVEFLGAGFIAGVLAR